MADAFDDFVQIEKNPSGTFLPANTIRIGKGIGFSRNVSEYLFGSRITKGDTVRLELLYSATAKALKLVKSESSQAFAFTCDTNSNTLRLNALPIHLQRLRIPRGLYICQNENKDIFVFDEDSPNVSAVESAILPQDEFAYEHTEAAEIGDIVTWPVRVDNKIMLITGQVVEIYPTRDTDNLMLKVQIFTQLYKDLRPLSPFISVPRDKVIIRRKKDA